MLPGCVLGNILNKNWIRLTQLAATVWMQTHIWIYVQRRKIPQGKSLVPSVALAKQMWCWSGSGTKSSDPSMDELPKILSGSLLLNSKHICSIAQSLFLHPNSPISLAVPYGYDGYEHSVASDKAANPVSVCVTCLPCLSDRHTILVFVC